MRRYLPPVCPLARPDSPSGTDLTSGITHRYSSKRARPSQGRQMSKELTLASLTVSIATMWDAKSLAQGSSGSWISAGRCRMGLVMEPRGTRNTAPAALSDSHSDKRPSPSSHTQSHLLTCSLTIGTHRSSSRLPHSRNATYRQATLRRGTRRNWQKGMTDKSRVREVCESSPFG